MVYFGCNLDSFVFYELVCSACVTFFFFGDILKEHNLVTYICFSFCP
uniref:Uncharacterized protein n=1 Tax=Anguilla anguilla TaxID=7936 RepID=A0A0E9WAF9_ANGAN